VEDDLQAKLTKLYQNKDIDNKQKIAEMVTLFNNNILPNYRTQYEKVLYTSSKSSLDKIVCDFYEEKAKRSEIIMDKYKRLSSEYQT
jgi:hypothetical protein|tara:strand:+ start:194 stop:454 length:261 start_codon:yes stop_codon:yes gene_type:complete